MVKKIFIWVMVILASALIGLGLGLGKMADNTRNTPAKAKYIFLFIGDGMGNAHVCTAESYLSYKAGRLGGESLIFSEFPYYGTASTHSYDKNITCSAAAGTAIACGAKTRIGMIGMNQDSVALRSVAYDLHEQGYNVGIISNVPINHATPASFYANNINRGNYYEISNEIPQSGFEFFAGAGFIDYKGKDNSLVSTDRLLEQKGYTVSYGLEEFRKESKENDRIILCQASNRDQSADNYVSDGSEEDDMMLSEMLQAGLDFISDEEPFFIMCEGGTIDWAGHENRTMCMVTDILEFNDAVKTAYEFYQKYPDETLIVVTSDHETGGLSLGCGNKTVNWEKLEKQWINSNGKNILNSKENKELNRSCSIGWTTSSHTGGHVPVYAIGCGAERFNGRMDNTEIKGKILAE